MARRHSMPAGRRLRARRMAQDLHGERAGSLRHGVDHQDQPAGCGAIDPGAVASRIVRPYERNMRATRLKRRDRVTRVLTPPLPGPTFAAAVRRRLPSDLADFVSFLHLTGWRWRSEAARLRWTNVAFDAGEVRLEPGTTKTGEGRVFPFTADLRALFERRRAVARERERELGRVIAHVFTRLNGAPIGSFNKAWATACRAAGVAGRVLHDFRRTAVRNLVRAGVVERVAMQLVGWRSRQMLDRYHIVNASDLVDAARKLDAAGAR